MPKELNQHFVGEHLIDKGAVFQYCKDRLKEYLINNKLNRVLYLGVAYRYPDLLNNVDSARFSQAIDDLKCVCQFLHSMNFVVLKGLPLNVQMLPNIWNRRTSDIDILVPEEDLDTLAHILLNNQFEYTNGIYTTYLDDTLMKFEDNHHIHSFIKRLDDRVITIEPHRHPFSKKRIDYGADTYQFDVPKMLRCAESINMPGDFSVKVLNINEQFVQLIMHFTTHILAEIRAYIFRLRPFNYPFQQLHCCTLFYLVKVNELSLDKLIETACRWGVTYDMKYALRVMKEVYRIESTLIDNLISQLNEKENPNRVGYRSFRILFYNISQKNLVFKADDILEALQENNYISVQPL